MQIKCTTQQAQALLAARSLSTYERKSRRRAIMRQIHADHNLPKKPRLVLFVEDPQNPLYCVIRNATTRMPIDDGRPEPVALPAPKVEVKAVKKAVAKKVAAPAKKVAAKKAPAKAVAKKVAAPAKKVAAKKVATKPAAKAVKAPAKKVTTVKATVKGNVKTVTKSTATVKTKAK